jgi:hypothetical protein
MSESEEKIQFKPIKRKNIRQRKNSSDDEAVEEKEDDHVIKEKLEVIAETKEKQKLRSRQCGVNA